MLGQCGYTSAEVPCQLRSSCDACASVKVKCSQDHPSCARCRRTGTKCVYGISRKATRNGATSRKHRNNSIKQSKEKRSSPCSPHSHSDHSVDHLSFENDHDLSLQFSAPEEVLPAVSNAPMMTIQQTTGAFASTTLPTTTADLAAGSIFGQHNNQSPLLFQPSNLFTPSMNEMMDILDSVNMEPLEVTQTASVAPSEAVEDDDLLIHNCCTQAVQLIVDLQFKCNRRLPSSRQSISECLYSQDDSKAAAGYQTPPRQSYDAPTLPFDDILSTCQATLVKVTKLMRCSCASKLHMAVRYACIISAILYWLRCAVDSPIEDIAAATTSASQYFGAVDLADPQQRYAPCSRVTPKVAGLPSSVGSYILEEEDQDAIRRTLIESQLRRVSIVIQQLWEMSCDLNNPQEAPVAGIHKMLAFWLQGDMTELAKRVQPVHLAVT